MIQKNAEVPFFQVGNIHMESCGVPPTLNADGKYLSYFENSHGEQWVFIGDRETKTATIYGGDIQWDRPRVVSSEDLCPDLILAEDERIWMLSCWCAFLWMKMSDAMDKWNATASRISVEAWKKVHEKEASSR